MSETDERAMRRALELAARGPLTGGNPQVGAVLIDDTGAIVAEGWHRGAGTPHAEVDALLRLAELGRQRTDGGPDASGLTAVVTLEPCDHTGRTGPCSVALIEAGVERVVYALADPDPHAAGGGARLRGAGIPVTEGVLAADAAELLRVWLTTIRRGRPWVTVKWAATLDGRVAAADGTSQWITGTAARQRVHEQRAENDAILTGTGTVLADDPSLTARGDAGELLPHQPVPVVMGERTIPPDAALRRHPAGIIETGTRDLDAVLRDLSTRGIRRVLVEAGPGLVTAVVAGGFADEFAVYLAPTLLGGDRLAIGDLGIPTLADARQLRITGIEQLGEDVLIMAEPRED
ncbi:MAG: bifunctional diaminohydroxyphosphoribosylaminopyrimidine deaminase/5-amino-6-(5-phosphoribosylamino)uracil reductase RibD [Microbacteriaceae bacterium]|nr:bifunctional diaminohydroxyphosphoribosylaminopyrimidine deaminase/5-amino-6-(5-phosphoribosylamino)uracil reductase RibD [Microbacteriaceae bacterium]